MQTEKAGPLSRTETEHGLVMPCFYWGECCFPKGCKIDEDGQRRLARVFIPRLEAAGMRDIEWAKGALLLKQPQLDQVKAVVCKGCAHADCRHYSGPLHRALTIDAVLSVPEEGADSTVVFFEKQLLLKMQGQRQVATEVLIREVLPLVDVQEYERRGVSFVAINVSVAHGNLRVAMEVSGPGSTDVEGVVILHYSRVGGDCDVVARRYPRRREDNHFPLHLPLPETMSGIRLVVKDTINRFFF